MAHIHFFHAHNLIFLCTNLPSLSVKGQGERHSDMLVHTNRHGAVRYRLRVDATRSRVVKSI